jgi:hypothetical protein
MRALARALLVLNVLYCALAVAQDGLPGWHMFESVESLEHEFRDGAGERVDVRAWLPRGANLVSRSELHAIVAFICEKEAARGPFVYVEPPATGLRLDPGGPGGCKVHVPR